MYVQLSQSILQKLGNTQIKKKQGWQHPSVANHIDKQVNNLTIKKSEKVDANCSKKSLQTF